MNPYQSVLELSKSGGTPAQRRIRSAMLRMLEDHSPDQIEVRSLCGMAQTARSTFYLYYRNTQDVMEDLANVPVQELIGLVYCRGMANSDFVTRIWNCLSEHRETIRIAALRRKSTAFIERLELGVKYLLWERLFRGCGESCPEAELVTGMASSSLLQAFFHELEQEDTAVSEPGNRDGQKTIAVYERQTITAMLNMIENRISGTTIRCRVLKTGVPV